MTKANSESWSGAVMALLELTASGRPDLLELQLDALLNSPMRFAVYELASILGVRHEHIGPVLAKACVDVDRLAKRRGGGQDLEAILDSSNATALYQVCRVRAGRVSGLERRRLEGILRKLQRLREAEGEGTWIERFIGRSRTDSKPAPRDRRGPGKWI